MFHCQRYNSLLRNAFTLAEVLITLAVIGVLASMTIPALQNYIQDKELRSAFKKNYSDFNQVTIRIMGDNGGYLSFLDSSDLATKFSDYLSYTKYCPLGTSNGKTNCWHNNGTTDPDGWKYLNGTPGNGLNNVAGLVLNNGTLVWLYNIVSNCSGGTLDCAEITIDVNGWKKPNVMGRDIFQMHVDSTGLRPEGTNDAFTGDCVSSGHGYGCAAVVLKDENY